MEETQTKWNSTTDLFCNGK